MNLSNEKNGGKSKMDMEERQNLERKFTNAPEEFLRELSDYIKTCEMKKINDRLEIMETTRQAQSINSVKEYRESDDQSETLLHIAVKYARKKTIKRIIDYCPDLLSVARETSECYRGQTPLHIAITRGNTKVTELFLPSSKKRKQKNENDGKKLTMLNTLATGYIFANTVMMGELPLSVAALTFNKEIVGKLLDYEDIIHAKNSFGDTVLHSLVKYAAVSPNKTENVIDMFRYLIKRTRTNTPSRPRLHNSGIYFEAHSYLWFLENNENLTPLQLAAKLGVVEIFQFIIKLENVYSCVSTHDGLFDVKLYDISEIDTLAHVATTMNKSNRSRKVSKNMDGVSQIRINYRVGSFEYPKTESILEMIFGFDYENSSAFRLIEIIPVKNVILEKWQKLRYVYFFWGFFHLLLTSCLTAEIVIRSNIFWVNSMIATNITTDKPLSVPGTSKTFAETMSWISFFTGGLLYGVLVILLVIAKFQRPNAWLYARHNLGYICFLIVFSVCLIFDFIMTQASVAHDNVALILAVIAGWWFAVFFLRAIRLFSFFTEMIRRVIIGDLLRFAVIILFMLFAFTSGMYAVFVGKLNTQQKQSANYANAIDEHFKTFGTTMMTMFKLMLGLGDIEILFEARIPALALALYLVFALLTYVLLLNSLIAMMSQTCSAVLEDRYPQWRLQQLSVTLFIEDLMLCLPCIRRRMGSPGIEKKIDRYDPVTKRNESCNRYFFKIHSLQTTYASEEDKEAMKKNTNEIDHHRMDASMKNRSIQTDTDSSFHGNKDQNHLKPARQDEESSRVEEETIVKQRGVKLGSVPELIKSDILSTELQRHTYNSEDLYERENHKSLQYVTPLSSEYLKSNTFLPPVELKLDTHTHASMCPEKRVKKAQRLDIEPYPF